MVCEPQGRGWPHPRGSSAGIPNRTLNTDHKGFRRTRQRATNPDRAAFVFDGSTVFGLGVPDDHTSLNHMLLVEFLKHGPVPGDDTACCRVMTSAGMWSATPQRPGWVAA